MISGRTRIYNPAIGWPQIHFMPAYFSGFINLPSILFKVKLKPSVTSLNDSSEFSKDAKTITWGCLNWESSKRNDLKLSRDISCCLGSSKIRSMGCAVSNLTAAFKIDV